MIELIETVKNFLKDICKDFITSIISGIITVMLYFIIQKIDFVGNINNKTTFFWLFFVPMHFLIFCLLNKYCFKHRDLNSYNKEDMWWSRGSIKHSEEVKQFCYDFSNPCPYCDTKFQHTALHCAVYFNDIERLKEVIDLIKKVDGVDEYYFGLSGIFGKIFDTKDFRSQTSLILAIEIGSLEIIKLLLQIITEKPGKVGIYTGNNEWMDVNPENEETLNRLIDSYQYKKHQTGKDILNKDQEQQNLIKNEHEKRIKR